MDLRFELNTPFDLLQKLRREFALLDEEVGPDHLFNFVVTSWSLTDWLIKSEWGDPPAPDHAERTRAVNLLRKNLPIRICRDIGNGSKHFSLDKPDKNYPQIVDRTEAHRGWGWGRWGKGQWGNFEPTYLVHVNGKTIDMLDVGRDVLQLFENFFIDNDVQPYAPPPAPEI